MKKRILLLVGNELCIAGVPNVIMNIVQELHEVYTFDVLTFSNKPGKLDSRFCSYGGTIFSLELPRYPQHPIACFFAYQQLYTKVKGILQENHYDVVHGHSGYFDGICLMAARQAGIPVRISHGHGNYTWIGRNFLVKAYLELGKLLILKNATNRLACSDIAGKTLFLNQTYLNVLNPVDISQYADIDKKPHKGIHLLQIGYFCTLKNQIFSLRLLNHLHKQGTDVHLSLIGYPQDQKYLEEMCFLIAQQNLAEHVSFLPHDFDKRVAFAQTDYCLFPSASEGLGLAALESQAASVPCLMSENVPKDADVGAGFFLPHDNLEKWAAAIITGVDVDTKRLSDNLQMITTQVYAEKIRNIYEQKL